MKKSLLILACIQCSLFAAAQLYVSPGNSITIAGGTALAFDSLVLTPTSDYTFNSTTIQKSATPIVATAGQSIKKVYSINPAITAFTGTLDMFYDNAQLNGNTASLLQIAYNPNTSGNNGYVTTTGGTVNTGTNKISQSFSNKTFGQITAVNNGVSLPISLTSFRATLFSHFVALEWTMYETSKYDYFEVEMSKDGNDWNKIGLIAAQTSSGEARYNYNDADIDFASRYYRIRLVGKDGSVQFSNTEKVVNNKSNSSNIVVRNANNTIHISFTGTLPSDVVIRDILGKLVWENHTIQSEYTVDRLIPGTYIVVYNMNGQQQTTKFILP